MSRSATEAVEPGRKADGGRVRGDGAGTAGGGGRRREQRAKGKGKVGTPAAWPPGGLGEGEGLPIDDLPDVSLCVCVCVFFFCFLI